MKDFFLEFLTRPGCHLCEEAEPAVRKAAALARYRVREVNIDSDPELAVDWGIRIPVVLGRQGTVLAEGQIEFFALLKALIRDRLRSR